MKKAAWTTENSEAIIWGTHDTAAAKAIYDAQGFDYEPAWGDSRKMWGAPHLSDQEVWDQAEYGDEPREGWTPYMVFDLA